MNGQNQNPAVIKEVLVASVVGIIAAILGNIIPFFGVFMYFSAILFFMATRRYGFIFVLPFAFFVYAAVGLYSGFVAAMFDILAVIMPAIVMGELSRINREQSEILGKGLIVSILFNLAAIISQFFISGKPMVETMRLMMAEPLNSAVDTGEITLHMAEAAQETYEMMLKAVPSILLVWSVMMVFFIYHMGCKGLIKRKMVIEKYLPFQCFSFPKTLFYGVIVIYLFAMAAVWANLVDSQSLYLNLLLLTWFIFALQGAAVLTFFSFKMGIPKALFVLLMFFLCISVLGTIALFFLGVVDLVVNFRMRSAGGKG